MLLKVHPVTPQKRIVDNLLEGFRKGELYILPTDTVYAFVCSLDAPRAINEIYKIKGLSENHHLSLLCRDVAMASMYAQSISSTVFRFMKSRTPGPYTFIFRANRNVDRRGMSKGKTVGVRIVDHPLIRMLLDELDQPLISSSITVEGEYASDPEDLERLYGRRVAGVVDGGIRTHEFSTILDCTDGDFHLVRKGKGSIEELGLSEE